MKYIMIVLLVVAACDSGSADANDGEACGENRECSSGSCIAGFCGGATCECDPVVERDCSTAPYNDEDCQSGWMCVSTIATAHVSGFCRLPCSKGCPSTWTCRGDFCGYDAPDPTVSIESAPTELEVGASGSFIGSATSPNGAITSFVWELGDGTTAEGYEISHAYTDVGTLTYSAIATDAIGSEGEKSGSIRVCLPDGSACYPFDSRGACCSGKRCADTDGTSTRCQD